MAFQVSPGVNVTEIDLTTVIPAVSTTTGGFAGHFRWGPVNKRILVDSENTLVANFQKPNSNTATSFFTAANFLSYANALQVVRTNSTSANNASAAGVGRSVLNNDDYENNYSTGVTGADNWVAKYPGLLGNSLKVSICQSSNAWSSTLTGNLVYTDGSTAVTGNNTVFTTELVAGDLLVLGPDRDVRKVASIANNTSLTLSSSYSGNTVTVNAQGSNGIERRWEYYSTFDRAPGTTAYATTRGGANDELHVAVVDEDGEWTNIAGTVLERYEALSRASDAKKEDGSTNYYKEVINQTSPYIWWAGHDSTLTNAGSVSSTTFSNTSDLPQTDSLSGGTDGSTPTNAELINAFDYFRNAEDVDVSLMLTGDASSTVINHIIDNIAEVRKDILVCVSPERADVVNNSNYSGKETEDIVAFRNTLTNTSYAIMDSGWKQQYDKYNDLNRYVPLNGDTAGLIVRTDITRDPWYSPAGFNRGIIKNVVKLAFNPRKAERDLLFPADVNPVVNFAGQGTILFGDKTLYGKPSAFDAINVRRLFIVLEKAISAASQLSLFEFNDEFTRAQFRNLVNPFLRDVQGRRGITDFRVVCDTTNNTPEVIDRNEFIGDIYIKPSRAIRYIQLNFIAVRTGVEFSEIVGQEG